MFIINCIVKASMKALNKLLFFILILPTLSFGKVLQQQTVARAYNGLIQLINSNIKDGVKVLIPGIVRLAFHDCVDGCDACFNPKLIANRNLMKTANALEKLYQDYESEMSRADFWALASKAAIKVGVDVNNARCEEESCKTPEIDILFRYGRTDCATSPFHNNKTFIPSPLTNSSTLFPWFKKEFNFKPNQVVAIMGMHTLGKAGNPFNSSWEKGNTDGISNLYYKNIADANHCWVQEKSSPQMSGLPHDVYFWRTERFRAFALPVDMTLFKAIQVNETTGESSCTYHDCKRASTMGMFKRYAADVKNWAKHIKHLFRRLIEKTNNRLRHPRKPRSLSELI